MILFFISQIISVQYCITDGSDECDCGRITKLNPDAFSDNTISNAEIVDLYFCTELNKRINISQINRQLQINSFRKIELRFDLTQMSNTISLSFQNVNILVENFNSVTLNVNSLYLFESNFRQANNQKFSLETQRFSTNYESYFEFNSVVTDYLRLLQYDIWAHQDNPSISILPNSAQNQQIEIEVMNDCFIEFKNYSVSFINDYSFTINVKYKAQIDLYVTGTHYVFFSNNYIYGDNFIPVNIHNFITMPDRTLLRLNYTGLYGVSIPHDRYMTVSRFPSTITVAAHIQTTDVPLTFQLFENSLIVLDSNDTSIQGSVIAAHPNGQITTIINETERARFKVETIERLAGTTGTVQCSPQVDLILNRLTNNEFISSPQNSVYIQNLETSPGFGFHMNLAENPHIYTNVMIDESGVTSDLIEGSFSFPTGDKFIHLTFDSSISKDVYFYRYLKNDSLPILCNKLKFNCDGWKIDLKKDMQDYNEKFPFSFTQKCFLNSQKSMQCLSIQFNQSGEIDGMNQEIYVGNNVVDRSYNSLLSDETQFISSILDDSVKIIKLEIGVETTIDLRLFKEQSTLIIKGIDTQNSILNLIVSNENSNIPLHILVIDTCKVIFTGTYIQADKIVIYNCEIEEFALDLNTNDLCVPLSLYSNEKIRSRKYSSLTIFNVQDPIQMDFAQNYVLINSIQIDNNNFDSLWVYPINTIITAVNYNLIENTGSVKGISLNFSSYDVDGFYVIEKQIESQNVAFSFNGGWPNLQSIVNTFRFDLSQITTTLPEIPAILGLNLEFSGGNIVFNSAQQISIPNPVLLEQNLILNTPSENLAFSQININKSIDFSSGKPVTIQSLIVDRDVSVSLNPTSSAINSLIMNTGSQLSSQVRLQANVITYYFDLEKVPFVKANPLELSQIELTFVNSSESNSTNFIGLRHNVVCGVSLSCADLQNMVKYNSNVTGIDSNKISDAYKTNCTDPDSNNRICLYLYLDKGINLIYTPSKKKKVKPWVIALAVLIPLLVIIIVIIIVIVCLKKKKNKEKNQKSSSECVEKGNVSPRRKKIQAPIPPRRAVRFNPRKGRLVYNGNEDMSLSQTDENENQNQNGLSEEVINGFLNESEEKNQLSPSQKSKETGKDPENNSYQSDYF